MVSVKTETMTYPACDQDYNGRKCQKKMTDLQDPEGLYNCDRCGTPSLPNWRYLLNCRFADFTGTLEHVSIFGEAGEAIMGMPATQAHEVRASPPCPLSWHLMLCTPPVSIANRRVQSFCLTSVRCQQPWYCLRLRGPCNRVASHPSSGSCGSFCSGEHFLWWVLAGRVRQASVAESPVGVCAAD